MKNKLIYKLIAGILLICGSAMGADDGEKAIVEISRIESSKVIIHSSDTGGKLKKVYYESGEYVKKGSIVAELENEQVEASFLQAQSQYELTIVNYEKAKEFGRDQQVLNLEKAEGAVTRAKMALEKAKKGVKEEQLEQMRLNINTAKTNYDTVKNNYDKNTVMFNDKLISEQVYLQVKSQYETAENTLKSAQKAYELALKGADEEDIKSLEAVVKEAEANYSFTKKSFEKEYWLYDIRSAEAAMNSAKAQMELAKKKYEDLKVKAEYSGMVTSMNLEPGEKITPGKPMFSIVDNNIMILNVWVEEKNIGFIKKNGKADVFVSTLNKSYKGQIDVVNPIADEKSKKFEVKVKIKNESHQIKDGMHGEVNIKINTK